MQKKLNRLRDAILLFFVFTVIASASFHGFFTKWAFRDEYNAVETMMTETAIRPFVYRKLMGDITKGIIHILPEQTKENLINKYKENNFIEAQYLKANIPPEFFLEYYILYYISFLFLLSSMFFIRSAFNNITQSNLTGSLVAAIFVMIFPLFETYGGYYYDFGEILFFSISVYLITSPRFNGKSLFLLFPITAALAAYNKEAFLLILPAFYPLAASKLGRKKAASLLLLSGILGGLTYLCIRNIYASNPGATLNYWLYKDHVEQIFENWGQLEITYSIYFGCGMHWTYILLAILLISKSLKLLPTEWKRHAIIAFSINLPLYLFACYPGELRNFSLLYPTLWAMIGFMVKEKIKKNNEHP